MGVKTENMQQEVCGEHLANSASHIAINIKPAQVKLFGDIYTARPAEKHSADNSHETRLWHLLWESGR